MTDYTQIKSISIDMSTEEAPDNRIYAKPIEKQGDVLLCEFESANYDIEQKALKEENTKLKELLEELRKALQKETPALRVENAKLKTQVFLLKGLLDKWLPEFDYYNDTLTSQFCREARKLLGEE